MPKYLKRGNKGIPTEESSISVSLGNEDADKIVSTGVDGIIDISLLPPIPDPVDISGKADKTITILADGDGILGGGDLSANRIFQLDIPYFDNRYYSALNPDGFITNTNPELFFTSPDGTVTLSPANINNNYIVNFPNYAGGGSVNLPLTVNNIAADGVGNITLPLFDQEDADGLYYPLVGNPSNFLTAFSETDPIFSASPAFNISSLNISNWNTAYGWGDHSFEGYLTSETDPIWLGDKPNYLTISNAASTYQPIGTYATPSNVMAFTNKSGNISQWTNDAAYLTGITSGQVTTALGYTPYNATNPAGYITSSSLGAYLPLAGGTLTGSLIAPNIYGSTGASGTLTLGSTTHATKGKILFGTSAYDEVNNRLGVNTINPLHKLMVTNASNNNSIYISHTAPSFAAGVIITDQYGLLIDSASVQAYYLLRLRANSGASEVFTALANGYVGIGTATPDRKLDVAAISGPAIIGRSSGLAGAASITGLNTQTTGINYGIYGQSVGVSTGTSFGVYGVANGVGSTNNIGLHGYAVSGTNNTQLVLGQSTAPTSASYGIYNASLANNYFAGNVGIGMTSPQAKLQVNTTVTNDTTVNAAYLVNAAAGLNAGTSIRLGYGITTASTAGISGYYHTANGSGMNLGILVGATEVATFGTNGFMGIGITSPTSKLDVTTNSLGTTQTTSSGLALVNTTTAASGLQQISPAIRWTGQGWKTTATAASQSVDFRAFVTPVQGTTNPMGYLGFGSAINGGAYTDNQIVLTSAGNVGIGTTSPVLKFEVIANPTVNGRIAGFYSSVMDTVGEEAVIHIGGALNSSHYGIEIGATPEVSVPSVQDHAFIVKTNPTSGTGGFLERFRITSDGNVGIGLTAPLFKLDVAGTINATGNLYFGAATSSYPMIKRNLTSIDFRLADDSGFTGFTAAASTFTGSITLSNIDLVLGTTTGTKIGTSTTQKLGFWNVTPVVQPTTAIASATFVGGGGAAANVGDTYDGYTIPQIVKALRQIGILA